MGLVLDALGKMIAGYLQKEEPGYEPFTPSDPDQLRTILQPGDVLLVEGNARISGIIKYLTQSTWSHAALYVGPIDGAAEPDGEPHVLIEANIGEGVSSSPLSRHLGYHTRVCRPVGLSFEDRHTVCRYAINRIGFGYDTKNIIDLMRYLVPLPVPQRWRRRMIALGSGDPTKIICSALIAQAFDAVRYPILPKITKAGSRAARREILHIRDSSLYMPRDFDISPYFEVVKPSIVGGFDYTTLHWADKQKPLAETAGPFTTCQDPVDPALLLRETPDAETPQRAPELTLAEPSHER
ncbi:lipo-like protein [Rhodopseudomonas sp. HC1]|uniref:YiiX/YebB-like N1pC/P60 family cysteine hydrolase n=1 Tax=Rhodopseudomonas infernalis TaxID=2897386 RepID=UPI001EE935DB|nr:YiiX/YebB-like N1pC/P60 family cysteine hydrolase [Rhodopseudomonas infernalis]MCG6206642.1 lipo-like protein [Rhodopseudomonas infernalis]